MKIQPIGFSGLREAIRAPTVGNDRMASETATSMGFDPNWPGLAAESLRVPRTNAPTVTARQIAHRDQASNRVVEARIALSPRARLRPFAAVDDPAGVR
jgi:hypothetical protein